MGAKPSNNPDWATDHNVQPSSTANGDNQYDVIDPGSTLRQDGWDYKDVPTYETHNYLFKVQGQWLRWSENIFDYVTKRITSGVLTSEDYVLESLAYKPILQDDNDDSDTASAAPQANSLYLGNLTKAVAGIIIEWDDTNGRFIDTLTNGGNYNIESTTNLALSSGSYTMEMRYQDETNWTPKHMYADIHPLSTSFSNWKMVDGNPQQTPQNFRIKYWDASAGDWLYLNNLDTSGLSDGQTIAQISFMAL